MDGKSFYWIGLCGLSLLDWVLFLLDWVRVYKSKCQVIVSNGTA